MKKINKEILTAYALGELSPVERAEIEEVLQNNPELQKEVEEIQNFGSFLSEELKAEDLPKMTEDKRSEFMDDMIEKPVTVPWWQNLLTGKPFAVGVISTAVLGLAMFISVQQDLILQKEQQLSGTMEGLETSLAVDEDRANQPQLIPPQPPTVAQNGAEIKQKPATPKKFSNIAPHGTKSADKVAKVKGDKKELKEVLAASPDAGAVYDLAEADEESLAVTGVGGSKANRSAYAGKGRLMVAKRKKVKRGGRPIGTFYSDSYEPPARIGWGSSGNRHDNFTENPFKTVAGNPLSTFSIDVDTASYTQLRRYINQSNMIPPSASVRIEEMINYFEYDDPAPKGKDPFSVNLEVADSPWSDGHKLVRIGIKGKVFPKKNHKTNLVFLVDVSGSMDSHDKLGLLKEGLHKLVQELGEDDHISLVTYAGHSAVVLDSTSADQKKKIHSAIDNLTAGGSTHGSEGIKTAYELAQKNFRKEGVNRVILATDGDFNVGTTGDQDLTSMVKEKAKGGVFLTVLGFGSGNLNDSMMEKISNDGNGNYYYIDSEKEAKKVLVDKLQGTLVTIAKDVKIQVEFNPNNVASYRLIGYENRQLKAKDFNDDKKDAGEIGAGHTVVALYEVVPKGFEQQGVDKLKYQPQKEKTEKVETKGEFGDELMTVKLRYKQPQGTKSQLLKFPLKKASKDFTKASANLRWTASVAGFGMLLKDSAHKGSLTYSQLIKMTNEARWSGKGYDSYRSEFVELVKKAQRISGK